MARDMASALNPDNEQTSKVTKSTPTSTSTQRKRRKRATGNNGAAEDCFTCASRKTKCDRRRPYCTQCLNLGRNCSGYKTTLTWGVGVASRGKLRGFSLPVNKDQKKETARDDSQDSPKSSSRVSIDEWREQQSAGQLHAPNSVESGSFGLHASDTGYRNISSTNQVNSRVAPFPPQTDRADPRYRANVYERERTLIAPPSLTPASSSNHPSYPYDTSIPGGSASYIQPPHSNYRPPSYTPESASSLSYQPEIINQGLRDEQDDDDVEEIPYRDEMSRMERTNFQYGDSWFPVGGSVDLLPQLNLNQPIGQTPRLRYLISYYAEVISPVIVAFDSPTNPYRTTILRLAQESRTLQHAIAALAASNMRQRRESNTISNGRTLPAWRSSLAHSAMTNHSLQAQFGISDPRNDAKEESFHQRAAIQSLNAQLADPACRRADSVLATLLILSLFHICDSGVASFQTQFAGVKKLLSLRGTSLGATSEESKWFTKMFTFFDVLTATTNDREGQLQGIYLDMATIPDDQWSLENLVGCDARLFKVISRLNHLNVLSQNKPITEYPTIDSSIPFVPLPPAMTHFAAQQDNSQFVPDSFSYNSATAMHTDPDSRTEFWKEWRSVRQSLESWRLDTAAAPYNPASPSVLQSPGQVTPDNIPDLSNISEAFRYSALLYTERLADPRLPSSHPLIQNLVLTSLQYITAVRSDVYLLWPLFVTGTECVFESQRSVIRQRCQSIQKDSGFFNNISCLELLEKIWARSNEAETTDPYTVDSFGNIQETAAGSSKSLVPGGQAFRWRTVMDEEGLEGEYIVV